VRLHTQENICSSVLLHFVPNGKVKDEAARNEQACDCTDKKQIWRRDGKQASPTVRRRLWSIVSAIDPMTDPHGVLAFSLASFFSCFFCLKAPTWTNRTDFY
jgi:hypothetical protein